MAKRERYLTMVCHKHGCFWWLCIGWWWRPIKYVWWIFWSALCGFRKLKIERR